MDYFRNFFISVLPSSPAFYFAFERPSWFTILTAVVMPCIFFMITLGVNVWLKIYLHNRNKKD
ncbi:MAG TPA: hypothetical protein VGB00_02430 [Pyrinomonadaceae bacterium]|jgi:hypothetical protein